MSPKNLSDQQLLARTKQLAKQERELLIEVLKHLREIDLRKLFSAIRYKSLFDYATKELCYSEDQAYRRIAAMKLMREVPEVEQQIESGAVTLSTLSVAVSAFRAEKDVHGTVSTPEKKLDLIQAIASKPRHEAEQIARQIVDVPAPSLKPETVRNVGEQAELRLVANADLLKKVARVKGLLAHSDPYISTAQLLEKFCDEFIARHERRFSEIRSTMKPLATTAASDGLQMGNGENKEKKQTGRGSDQSNFRRIKKPCSENPEGGGHKRSRYIPASVRRLVWSRANGKCETCGSEHALEIDHLKPFALKGTNELENLKLKCRNCNQRSAINQFGLRKMASFGTPPTS